MKPLTLGPGAAGGQGQGVGTEGPDQEAGAGAVQDLENGQTAQETEGGQGQGKVGEDRMFGRREERCYLFPTYVIA